MSVSEFDDEEIAAIRRAYAKQILAVAGAEGDRRLEAAFASTPREQFLRPPWQLSTGTGGYAELSSCDPVLVYQDALFALSPQQGVNNGSPTLHARWLHRVALKPGDRVVHVGAGAGYYSAIMAALVGEHGHVLAVEFDPELADMAHNNLSHLPNVDVHQGDGANWPREPVDCIYVNFSVVQPAEAWIESLAPGGRLVFPIGVPREHPINKRVRHAAPGAALYCERHESGFAVRCLGAAFFVCAEGALAGFDRDVDALKRAFERGGIEFVQSLHWGSHPGADRCWFQGRNWSLSYDQVGS